MSQLPVEIWLHILELLPQETTSELIGLNRLFFDHAMNIRYGEIEFHDVTRHAFKTLSQLHFFPSLAKRVHTLKVRLNQFGRHRSDIPLPYAPPSSSDPSTASLLQRLTSALLHRHFRSSPKSAKAAHLASVEALLNQLTSVLPAMVNVTVFHVDSWNMPEEHDLLPFFSAAWLGFGKTLRSLSLGGSIEGFKVIKASQPDLQAVNKLYLEFTDNMNPHHPNSPAALTAAATTQTLLQDFVAPFVNGLGAHLEVLKLWSLASTDLSSFFKTLSYFPSLRSLSIWASFSRSFTYDSTGLTDVLYRASPTLKKLKLRLNTTMLDPGSDLALCQWLTSTVHNNDQFSKGLEQLELYPSSVDEGLDALVLCIQRSSQTLEVLNVRDRYLFTPEVNRIASLFTVDTRLTYLRLNVKELPVSLFDLFSVSFPNLNRLHLRAADGEPAPGFADEMKTRQYLQWNLDDITIWRGGSALEYEIMLILSVSIPSAEDSCFDLQLVYQSTDYLSIRLMASVIVNIRRDVDDKFYRYRMPLLLTKIEGKGNGIKTVIPNMSDVARALSRPPTYTTKFFGCELGAQTVLDEKNDRYIVNGAHNAERLRELLDGFIDKFVLCKSCKNPETELVIIKNGRNENIIRDCKACGEQTDIDMRHKLTTFILKNPPVKIKKGKNKNAGGAADGVGGGGRNEDEAAEANGAESDDELTKKIKAEAAELNDDAALTKDDWSADTSPEAVKQRVKALESAMGSVALAGDDEGSDEDVNSPYSLLGKWIEESKDDQEDPKAFAIAIFKKAEEFGIEKKHRTVLVLVQALFTDAIVNEVAKYGALFAKMVTSEKHQKALLGGLERFIGILRQDLIPIVPKILMAFYQIDVLDEEVVVQWGTHVSKKYVDKETSKRVRKASEPFLKWLEEADDDEDDDEE
ncbi:hypothetical protein H0H93_012353 [Arthromyces matolae]|nr:hypothetical protein H0H93_012353 [Arthromyces matolae]